MTEVDSTQEEEEEEEEEFPSKVCLRDANKSLLKICKQESSSRSDEFIYDKRSRTLNEGTKML